MTVLVDAYEIRESNKPHIKMCHECTFVAAWCIQSQLVNPTIRAYACSSHVDQVLFLVDSGKIDTCPDDVETDPEQ